MSRKKLLSLSLLLSFLLPLSAWARKSLDLTGLSAETQQEILKRFSAD